MNLIYQSPVDFKTKVVYLNNNEISTKYLRSCVLLKENLQDVEFLLYHNGQILENSHKIESNNDIILHVALPIKGGKGGFGSMLRAIGAQIEKTTNREACRDLSGRRLRDVNEEKRIKDWVKKQAQKKEEEEKKKKEKLKRLAEMTVPASCQYSDTDFEKTRAEIPDIVEDSIAYGLKQNSKQPATSTKRKADEIENNVNQGETSSAENIKRPNSDGKIIKKQALWLGVDIDSDDSDDSDDSEDEMNNEKGKKVKEGSN